MRETSLTERSALIRRLRGQAERERTVNNESIRVDMARTPSEMLVAFSRTCVEKGLEDGKSAQTISLSSVLPLSSISLSLSFVVLRLRPEENWSTSIDAFIDRQIIGTS